MPHDVATTFLRWTCMRAVFHRGYVLTSSLYFVLVADLSASQLLVLGAVMAGTLVVSDIPAGAWSDAFSRKWPIVIGHAFLAAGMVMTGLVRAFPLILVTQVLWALGWAFSGGADVAWVTDELDQPDRIARVLTARARLDLIGGATGMVAFGVLGRVLGLGTAIVISGGAMGLVGLFVATRFTEDNFTPAPERRGRASWSILARAFTLARRDREIMIVFIATLIVNGAGVVAWLFPKQLVAVGFPNDPVLWYTALGIVSSVVGVAALRVVERRIDRADLARRMYAWACLVGGLGLVVLACAPDALMGAAGVLMVDGIAFNVTRAVSVIWVNRRVTSDVRATVHSFLSQAETVGETCAGLALAALAHAAGMPATLVMAAVLFGGAAVLVGLARTDREPRRGITRPALPAWSSSSRSRLRRARPRD